MTTDNLDLEALRGLLDAATPGPWEAKHDGSIHWIASVKDRLFVARLTQGLHNLEDLDLIVALVNAAPALIAAARERDAVVALLNRERRTPPCLDCFHPDCLLETDIREVLGEHNG